MKLARCLFLIAVLTAFGLVTVWQRLEMLRLGYEIHELERVAERLGEEARGLEVRIGELTGPGEVSRRADEIGLERAAEPPGTE